MKYIKSSYSKYMKRLQCSNPNNASVRDPYFSSNDLITHKQFKLVLPMVLKDNVSGKGGNLRPKYPCIESMNVMINCLKLSDYNEAPCSAEIKDFTECFQKYSVFFIFVQK